MRRYSLRLQKGVRGLGPGLVACALLYGNLLWSKGDTDLARLRSGRRYWEDLSVGIKQYFDATRPVSRRTGDIDQAWPSTNGMIVRLVRRAGVPAWQFWRALPDESVLPLRNQLAAPRPFEDQGRARALALAFRLRGGVAPFLLLWLAFLGSLPVLMWVSWEFVGAGHRTAGTLLLLLVASSSYLIDCLTLPHAAVGFYLIAVLALVALSAHTCLRERVSRSGILVRAAMAGVLFAACAQARSSTLPLAAGFLLSLGIGSLRVIRPFGDAPVRYRCITMAAAALLFLLPGALTTPHRLPYVWPNIWKGLGDFDRTKVHVDSDKGATEFASAHAVPPGPDARFPFLSLENDAFFRSVVLEEVTSDPAWYARILARRVFATVTQERLWPWGPWDGISVSRAVHPNEGAIDKYYRMTSPADSFQLGPWRYEIPAPPMVVPTMVLLLACYRARRGRRRRMEQAALVVACSAVATLVFPVLMTTGGGMETQAFAVVHALALCFVLEEALRSSLIRRTGVVAQGKRAA